MNAGITRNHELLYRFVAQLLYKNLSIFIGENRKWEAKVESLSIAKENMMKNSAHFYRLQSIQYDINILLYNCRSKCCVLVHIKFTTSSA